MADPNNQPNPRHINLPEQGDVAPDQPYLFPWMRPIQRRWIYVAVAVLVVGISVFFNFYQGLTYEPEVKYFTAGTGYTAFYNDAGRMVIDSVVYKPGPFRYVLEEFVENRYEYNWMDPWKVNDGLSLMSERGRDAEVSTLQAIGFRENIIEPQLQVDLKLDWADWELLPLGNGRYRVEIQGEAHVLDGQQRSDPANPEVYPIQLELVIASVRSSNANPYGYMVISTGKDVYWQIQD